QMQTGSRRSHRSTVPREDRLVAVSVLRAVEPLDVRGQWHVTDRVDGLLYRRSIGRPQTNDPPAVKPALEHLRAEHGWTFEDGLRARTEPLTGVHQGFPSLTRRTPHPRF